MATKNEMIPAENGGFLTEAINLSDLFSEELDGLRPTFDRIKVPAEHKHGTIVKVSHEILDNLLKAARQ